MTQKYNIRLDNTWYVKKIISFNDKTVVKTSEQARAFEFSEYDAHLYTNYLYKGRCVEIIKVKGR